MTAPPRPRLVGPSEVLEALAEVLEPAEHREIFTTSKPFSDAVTALCDDDPTTAVLKASHLLILLHKGWMNFALGGTLPLDLPARVAETADARMRRAAALLIQASETLGPPAGINVVMIGPEQQSVDVRLISDVIALIDQGQLGALLRTFAANIEGACDAGHSSSWLERRRRADAPGLAPTNASNDGGALDPRARNRTLLIRAVYDLLPPSFRTRYALTGHLVTLAVGSIVGRDDARSAILSRERFMRESDE